MKVYVLLFNARTENEGIHSLQLGDQNVILMFEAEDDAIRYGVLLEAQDFMTPTVEALDSQELEDFCVEAGYSYRLVPEGFVPTNSEERLLLVPPEINLEDTDWDPAGQPDKEETSEAVSDSVYEKELDQIRRRLEDLL